MPQAYGLRLTDRYLTYCAKRFDRVGMGTATTRRMFSSAMTLLEFSDGEEGASYLDLAQFINDRGAQGHIESDLAQLFRRVIFNIRIGNRDDHLRNHGFIRTATGWRLSPAYDINPNPHKATHTLSIDGYTTEAEVDAALACAELYRVGEHAARTIMKEVDDALKDWRREADQMGLPRSEIMRMESVIQA